MINGQSMTTGTQETLYLREVAAGRTTLYSPVGTTHPKLVELIRIK